MLNADNPNFVDPLKDVLSEYFGHLKNAALTPAANSKSSVKFTYTAMHGVGYRYMKEAFHIAGFKVKVSHLAGLSHPLLLKKFILFWSFNNSFPVVYRKV